MYLARKATLSVHSEWEPGLEKVVRVRNPFLCAIWLLHGLH